MSETRIVLTGWKAMAALAFVLAIGGLRVYLRLQTITDEGQETLRTYLVKDYEGLGPRGLAQMASDAHAGLPVHVPETPAAAPQVEFTSLGAHGGPQAMIVRAEVTVDGGPPPDNRRVRYLLLTTKFGGGWMITRECNAYDYYESLLK